MSAHTHMFTFTPILNLGPSRATLSDQRLRCWTRRSRHQDSLHTCVAWLLENTGTTVLDLCVLVQAWYVQHWS